MKECSNMKILKTDEWELRGVESGNDSLTRGFVFQNKKYQDYVVVQAAKYIIKSLGIVLFLTFSAGVPKISLSHSVEMNPVSDSRLLDELKTASPEEQICIVQSLASEDKGSDATGVEVRG